MRFVAGRGAVAKLLLAEALWRSCCRQGTVGTEDCWQGRCSEEPSGRCCWPGVPWRRGWRHCGREPSGRAAGRGALAELLAGGTVEESGKRVRQQAPARQAICRKGCTIGKMLPAEALWRRAIGKQARKEPLLQARKEPPRQAGKEHPALQANKKESGKTHSLKPALVMTALVRVTGARPRGSSQLLLCSWEFLW